MDVYKEKSAKNCDVLDDFCLELIKDYGSAGVNLADKLISLMDFMHDNFDKECGRSNIMYKKHLNIQSETEIKHLLLENISSSGYALDLLEKIIWLNKEYFKSHKSKLFTNVFVVMAKPDHKFLVIHDKEARKLIMVDPFDNNLICEFTAKNLMKHSSLYDFYDFRICSLSELNDKLGTPKKKSNFKEYIIDQYGEDFIVDCNTDSRKHLRHRFMMIDHEISSSNKMINNKAIFDLSLERCKKESREIFDQYIKEGKIDISFKDKMIPYVCLMNRINKNLIPSKKHFLDTPILEELFAQKLDMKSMKCRLNVLKFMDVAEETLVNCGKNEVNIFRVF